VNTNNPDVVLIQNLDANLKLWDLYMRKIVCFRNVRINSLSLF
jgi:hypothetical protein